MIFVIMGMEVHPFDRLAKAIDELQAKNTLGEDFFIQLGACTYVPRHARWQKFLSFGEVCANIQGSSAVITHAGAGSTLVCIQQGKHPIMVPRRSRFGEHVDEHQVPFAEKLSGGGLAEMVDDLSTLEDAVRKVRDRRAADDAMGRAAELTSWLEGFWRELEGRAK